MAGPGAIGRQWRPTFGDASPGEMVVHVDSACLVATAVNGGRAVNVLLVEPGDMVAVVRVAGGPGGCADGDALPAACGGPTRPPPIRGRPA
ncbi:SAM hydroxide adenosyltransferase [Micromonospora rubida]|uniref:SAM hydroxide adenosyltransferase n=1 Tax=Micromonospora rubida TaxID=2697657 RepID=UPI001379120B|nr:SAM hydroxide adenosyltransferase [Micromonospora rubida]NBE84301.1 hypothetical protein [Micromonospora rubida]